jgi:hypothetical protein
MEDRRQVFTFSRDSEKNQIIVRQPDQNPRGMGAGGVLTSDFFGLDTELDPTTQIKLDRLRQLTTQDPGKLSEKNKKELKSLDNELAEFGLNYEFRDPLYGLFLKEWAEQTKQEHKAIDISLSSKDRSLQAEMARKIVAKLKSAKEG